MGRYEVLETVAIADCALEIAADELDDLPRKVVSLKPMGNIKG